MDKNDRSNSDEQAPTDRSVSARTSAGGSGEWERVEQTPAFGELTRRKKAFIVPAAVLSFTLIMSWLILAGLTTVLDGRAIGEMTWASVYGFALFAVALTVLHLYMGQAKKWDSLAEEARREASEKRTNA